MPMAFASDSLAARTAKYRVRHDPPWSASRLTGGAQPDMLVYPMGFVGAGITRALRAARAVAYLRHGAVMTSPSCMIAVGSIIGCGPLTLRTRTHGPRPWDPSCSARLLMLCFSKKLEYVAMIVWPELPMLLGVWDGVLQCRPRSALPLALPAQGALFA